MTITLSYATELDVEDGKLRFTLPTAIGARAGHAPRSSAVPNVSGTTAGLSLRVNVHAHSAITSVDCPSHKVVSQLGVQGSARRAQVTLSQDTLSLGDDFRLLIGQLKPHAPCVWLETPPRSTQDTKGGAQHADTAATTTAAAAAGGAGVDGSDAVVGPNDVSTAPASLVACMFPDMQALDLDNDAAGEYIFVVDRSGSMSGSRMRHAQDALQMCLRAIPAGSTFNIVGFGTRMDSLYTTPQPYDDSTLAQATAHVRDMKANLGGTDLMEPLRCVFAQPADDTRPRQVFLLTDGEVRDTRSVVSYVRNSCESGETRVFTLGIGREVSHALVSGVASAGGGHAEFISPDERMEQKVMRQMNRAIQPVMTQVRVNWGELSDFATHSGTPAKPAPLFQGSRALQYTALQLTAGSGDDVRCLPPTATVTLSATTPDGRMEWPLTLRLPASLLAASATAAGKDVPTTAGDSDDEDEDGDDDGVECNFTVGRLVATAAARSRIRDLEQRGDDKAREEGVKLACAYDVACKWASFVAVDMQSAVVKPPVELTPSSSRSRASGARPSRSYGAARSSAARSGKSAKMKSVEREAKGLRRAGMSGARAAQPLTARVEELESRSAPMEFRSSAQSRSLGVQGAFASVGSAVSGALGGLFGSSAPSSAPRAAQMDYAARNSKLDFESGAVDESEDDDLEGFAAPGGLNHFAAAAQAAPAAAGASPAPPAPPAAAAQQAVPASVSADAASTDAQQVLKAIVALQMSDGHFNMSPAIHSLARSSAQQVADAQPDAAPATTADAAAAVWATALVLAVLELHVADFREEWTAMARKAVQWLRRNVASVVVPGGGDSKAQAAQVQSMASALVGGTS